MIDFEPLERKKFAIEARGIYKSFGNIKALDGIDLTVPYNSIHAFLGPNGAGKTTLVRILTTLLLPNAGVAKVGGYDVLAEPQEVRKIIGLTGQYVALDEDLTGKENLELVGGLYHLAKSEVKKRAQDLLESFELAPASGRLVKTYSGGMRRRLDLALSLIADPKILFLDEPTTGLDPKGRIGLWQIIKTLVKRGTTVLLTTQYLEEADELADKITVIDRGKIIAVGTANELKSQVGGDVLELHVADRTMLEKAQEATSLFAAGKVEVNYEENSLRLPVAGSSVLTDIVRILADTSVEIMDLRLRKPTLDEAFLSLTEKSEGL